MKLRTVLPRSLRRFFVGLLRLETINDIVYKLRYLYFVRIRRRLAVHPDEQAVIMHEYSQQQMDTLPTGNRPLRLIRPLSSIECVKPNAQILAIGCRFEAELLYLVGYGYKAENIKGLDMISYSPWVDQGNMHDLSYQNDQWDVVLMGWVISYSDDPKTAADEAIRVTKNGGVIAIGLTHYPADQLENYRKDNPNPTNDASNRIQSTARLLELFEGHVDQVYFSHDVAENVRGSCMVIFSIKK